MFEQRRVIVKRPIVRFVLLTLFVAMLMASAVAQEAPRDTGSLIKPPAIKPPTAKSQSGDTPRLGTSKRKRRIVRRTRARAARRRVATKRAVAPVPVRTVTEDSASVPHRAMTTPKARPPVSGGVLNGKALVLPAPTYPPIAKAANIQGTVRVRVLIDEDGKITEAEAISGPALLRKAAQDAAMNARFAPTQLSGEPVKVTGVITYEFVP